MSSTENIYSNLSKKFWKALESINKLSPRERMILCNLLVTVDHGRAGSTTTYKQDNTWHNGTGGNGYQPVKGKDLCINSIPLPPRKP